MIKGSKAIKAAPSGAASEARRAVWIVRLWPFLLAQRRKLAITLAATLVAQVASVSLPLIQKIIVDDVIVAGQGSLMFWLVLFVAMATVTAVGTIIRRANGNSLGFGLQHDLREAVYRHVQRLDVGYRTDAEGRLLSSGEVISRSTADIALVQTLFSQLHVLAGSLITVVGSLAVMLVLSPGLGLVALVTLPLIAVFALLMRQRIYPAVWADQRAQAELAGIVSETTTGVKVIRAFGQQQREFDRYVGAAVRLFGSRLRTAGINALYSPAMQAVPVIGQVGVLSIGALLAWNGAITVGTFLAFFAYLIQLAQPVRTLTNALSTVQQARAGTDRVFELLDTFPEVVEASNAPRAQRHPRQHRAAQSYIRAPRRPAPARWARSRYQRGRNVGGRRWLGVRQVDARPHAGALLRPAAWRGAY
jgi:ATP-binding cassette subfamily B protein